MRHDGDEAVGLHAHEPLAVCRARFDAFFPVLHLAYGSHTARLCGGNVLTIILLSQALTREAPARHAPEQESANGIRMAQGEKQRCAATRGTAADNSRQCTELGKQFMKIIGPDLVLGFVTVDNDIGCAAVAPVEYQHPMTGFRKLLGERLHAANIAPAAGRQRHPGSVIAQDFVVHVNAAHVSEGHNSSNRYGLVPAFPRRRKEAGVHGAQAHPAMSILDSLQRHARSERVI
jgi:hypothetical protein